MSRIDIRGLGKRYGAVTALSGIDLTIHAGARTAVVGPSGSGKTTLLRLIAGFEKPDAGEIVLDGTLISSAAGGVPPHRRNIGLVMQDGALFPHLTVLKNIAFGFDRSFPQPMSRALELMDMAGLDRSMAERRPHELSGGQQQRVALARALARRPKVMLLDEPFSALDAGLREQMREATADILTAAAITTVLVTHDQAEAMSFADKIVVLRDGKLRQSGTPRDVYFAPADRETAEFLGQAIVIDAVIAGGIAHCSLGDVPVAGSAPDGAATITLRPEQVRLHAVNGSEPKAPLARLVAADFAGPVVSIGLLVGGRRFAFKTAAAALPPVGSNVAVEIVGEAHVLRSH